MPFDWLVHLDRPPVNALELLNVSGFKPHELTQQFVYPTTVGAPPLKFQHYAPWNPFAPGQTSATIQSALIYRALDLLSTANHMPGTSIGSRQPGGINVNTVTEADIWQALCDSQDGQPNPRFNTNDVANIFAAIAGPNIGRNAPAAAPLNPLEGSPFKSFAAGNVADTMFRPQTGGTTPIFVPGTAINPAFHPTLRSGLLQKIFNNMTTTSNVFAVYWTVGFFEVTDETVQPPRLGQEIGRSENRNIRHRFFAIVDRSGMQLINTNSASLMTGTTSAWNPTTTYAINNLVVYQGSIYKSRRNNNTDTPPATNPPATTAKWTLESMTFNAVTGTPAGGPPPAFNPNQSYSVSNAVSYLGGVYFYTQPAPPPAATPLPTNAAYWTQLTLQQGMLVEITDNSVSPPVSEVVPVTWVNPNMTSFTAPFTQSYNPGSTIVCRGNPGPQTSYPNAYNPHKDNSVVLHLSIIK